MNTMQMQRKAYAKPMVDAILVMKSEVLNGSGGGFSGGNEGAPDGSTLSARELDFGFEDTPWEKEL